MKTDRATHAYWTTVGDTYAADDALAAVCYDGGPFWFNRFMARLQLESMERVWQSVRLASDALALDVGCGVGRWSRWLSDKGLRVIGVDLSKGMLRVARTKAIEGGQVLGSVADLPLAASRFDIAVSVTVLQHMPYEQQEHAIAAVSRSLRPGGTFLLLENAIAFAPGSHLYPRSPQRWTDVLAKHGLAVRTLRGEAYVPLVRVAYRLLGLLPRPARRAPSPVDSMKVNGTGRSQFTGSWLGRQRGPVALLGRLLVAVSYPVERVASALLGARFASNVVIVAERVAVGAEATASREAVGASA